MFIDRKIFLKYVNNFEIDYSGFAGELEKVYPKENPKKDKNRSESFEKIVQELRDFENEIDEPYETARRIALITEAFNCLGHIYTDLGENAGQKGARYMKNYFLVKMAKYCKENDITVGISEDDIKKDTLEVDLPYVGHLGWHFGRKIDTLDFISGLGIERYNYPRPERRGKSGRVYSNTELLLGELKEKDMNENDKALVKTGKRIGKKPVEI